MTISIWMALGKRCVLIAPFWYWNRDRPELNRLIARVLIAPFWYWNQCRRRHLLLWERPVLIAPFWYWNLLLNVLIYSQVTTVLIAPFWYWNVANDATGSRYAYSFNRTFLVLKCRWRLRHRSRFRCFNRTFLVLKSVVTDEIAWVADPVLIAPFWYWNCSLKLHIIFTKTVLIAPFWYWNLGTSEPARTCRPRF